MKYYKQIGMAGCLLIIVGCFLPFAYYPDLHQTFTGFYSEKNIYGKPGKLFTFFAVVALAFLFIEKIWAKRALIFVAALNIGYLIKTYIIYTSCYNAYCPEKKYGLFMVILGTVLLSASALFPKMKIDTDKNVPVKKEIP